MQPEHVAEFVAEYTAEYNRLNSERSAALASHKHELESVTRKLDGLIDAIAEGMRAPGLQQKLDALEARKAELTRLIENAGISLPLLHRKRSLNDGLALASERYAAAGRVA